MFIKTSANAAVPGSGVILSIGPGDPFAIVGATIGSSLGGPIGVAIGWGIGWAVGQEIDTDVANNIPKEEQTIGDILDVVEDF